ncbi:MAG: serine protease [bacterium]
MGALIPIAIRLFARIAITLVVSGVGLLLHNTSTSTPLSTGVFENLFSDKPRFVNIEDQSFDVSSKIPIATSTASTTQNTNSTTTKKIISPKQKNKVATTTIKAKLIPTQIPKTVQPATSPETPSPITEPSLKNLPVPQIDLIPNSPVSTSEDFGVFNTTYTHSHESTVNILCLSTKGNMVKISTGSGVIIHSQGIILTNAHVAETFLIPNEECTIRQGDIATDKYKASLVYINEDWMKKNAGVIFSSEARGTGENDFALLAITSKMDSSSAIDLPYSTVYTSEMSESNKGEQILATGYPGGTLGALSLRKYLPFSADVTKLLNVYTFSGSSIDIIETDKTKVGERGSSGGGIFNVKGELVGLIVSVEGNSTQEKINALSLPYIQRAFKNSNGTNFQDFISTDKTSLITSFEQKRSSLFEYVKPFVE